MATFFLLYMEDSKTKCSNQVDLFPKRAEARKAMKAAYMQTLKRLRFDTSSRRENHYCKFSRTSSIIIDGRDNYSWSIGTRRLP